MSLVEPTHTLLVWFSRINNCQHYVTLVSGNCFPFQNFVFFLSIWACTLALLRAMMSRRKASAVTLYCLGRVGFTAPGWESLPRAHKHHHSTCCYCQSNRMEPANIHSLTRCPNRFEAKLDFLCACYCHSLHFFFTQSELKMKLRAWPNALPLFEWQRRHWINAQPKTSAACTRFNSSNCAPNSSLPG